MSVKCPTDQNPILFVFLLHVPILFSFMCGLWEDESFCCCTDSGVRGLVEVEGSCLCCTDSGVRGLVEVEGSCLCCTDSDVRGEEEVECRCINIFFKRQ